MFRTLLFSLSELHAVLGLLSYIPALLTAIVQAIFYRSKSITRWAGFVNILVQLYITITTALSLIAYNILPGTSYVSLIVISILFTVLSCLLSVPNDSNPLDVILFYIRPICVLVLYGILIFRPELNWSVPYALYAHIRGVLIGIPIFGYVVEFVLNILSIIFPVMIVCSVGKLCVALYRKTKSNL